MLQLAYKHKDSLHKEYLRIIDDDRYKWLFTEGYLSFAFDIKNDTWNSLEMVSVADTGMILGYLLAKIDRSIYSVSSLFIINFYQRNLIFSKDFHQFLFELFLKHKFNKINFSMIMGNPIEPQYDRIVKKYGGRIIGVKKNDVMIHGSLYDLKLYEILRSEFNEHYHGTT